MGIGLLGDGWYLHVFQRHSLTVHMSLPAQAVHAMLHSASQHQKYGGARLNAFWKFTRLMSSRMALLRHRLHSVVVTTNQYGESRFSTPSSLERARPSSLQGTRGNLNPPSFGWRKVSWSQRQPKFEETLILKGFGSESFDDLNFN